jgi:hypothetical protein
MSNTLTIVLVQNWNYATRNKPLAVNETILKKNKFIAFTCADVEVILIQKVNEASYLI